MSYEVDDVETTEDSLPEDKPVTKRKPKEASTPKVVVFRSMNDEPREFAVNNVRARRCDVQNRIEWHVKAEDAEKFASHFHVKSGRIIRI